MKKQLIAFYLEWVNEWLTTERMAEHHGLSRRQTLTLIKLGKDLHEKNIKNLK